MDNIEKATYLQQVYYATKEEGEQIIAEVKKLTDDEVLFTEMERVNNLK